MVKKGNERVMITLNVESKLKLDFLCKEFKLSKTQMIRFLIIMFYYEKYIKPNATI